MGFCLIFLFSRCNNKYLSSPFICNLLTIHYFSRVPRAVGGAGGLPPADVEEVCCNGVIYLLSSDNLVYDGGHEEVGRWCNGVVVLHSGDCVPRTPSLIQGTSQGTASPEPPL